MTDTKKNTTKKTVKTVKKSDTVVKKDSAETVKKPVVAKKESAPTEKKTVSKTTPEAKKTEKKVKIKKTSDATYATGKRKNAIAKVWLNKGNGTITVNGKPANEYLKRAILNTVINQPFSKTETEGKFDITCSVLGGGLSGQAGAIKHAISVALQLLNPELRAPLKSAGFLTRDSRVVERKKAGLKKARKGQVFHKR